MNKNKALINFMIDEMVVLRQTIEKLQQDNKKLQEEISKLQENNSLSSTTTSADVSDLNIKIINNNNDNMEIIKVTKDIDLRCIEYILEKNNFLTGDDIVKGIYKGVFKLNSFKDLGNHKMVIVVGKDDDYTFNIHPNILVNNDTTQQEYFKSVKDLINNRYDKSGYVAYFTKYFYVKVWDMDHLKNKKIKNTRNAQGRNISSVKALPQN